MHRFETGVCVLFPDLSHPVVLFYLHNLWHERPCSKDPNIDVHLLFLLIQLPKQVRIRKKKRLKFQPQNLIMLCSKIMVIVKIKVIISESTRRELNAGLFAKPLG